MTKAVYVNYGCGWSAPPSWRNFDASPTLRFERLPFLGTLYTKNARRFPKNVEYGDIVRGIPIPQESCAGVYCSHVLEHLSLNDCRLALQNTKKILRPGGIFRFVLPDLEFAARRYLADKSAEASLVFMKETFLGHETRPKGIYGLATAWLGNSRHLWMWDYKSIQNELERAGFQAIRRAKFGDSSDPMFELVEEKGRWEGCLGVECQKLE